VQATGTKMGPAMSRPLRILFLAPQPFFEVRGTPLAVLAMTRALVEQGHGVDLLTFPQGRAVDVPGLCHLRSLGLPVGRVRPGFSFAKLLLDVPFMVQAAWRLAFRDYDVVHAVEEAAHLVAPVARLLGRALVADVDSSLAEQLRRKGGLVCLLLGMVRVLERFALRSSAAVITVCRELTEGVRRQAPQASIFQVEDPPLVDPLRPASREDVDALRAALGLGAGPVALYSGNLEPYQGVDLLVDALAAASEVQLVVMGGESEEIARLKGRAAGSAGRCFFVGQRDPEELPRFLALTDVVVSPRSSGGNTPFKIYTYLAAGRPLVATRISTHTQLLDDSLAMLVEPTAEGLARGLLAVLADPDAAELRARRAQALIERDYGATRFREKVAEAYAHVARVVAERGAVSGAPRQ
jgi:glycosyltransferase involved in cell wall biosynthesis